jgi:hypothetical protein
VRGGCCLTKITAFLAYQETVDQGPLQYYATFERSIGITMAVASETNGDGGGYYDDVDHLKKLCDFLRSRQGPPIREALLMEKRVQYLKGEKLINFLVEPKKGTKWPTNLPRFASRLEAISACKSMCKNNYLLRSEKRGKGELGVSRLAW